MDPEQCPGRQASGTKPSAVTVDLVVGIASGYPVASTVAHITGLPLGSG